MNKIESIKTERDGLTVRDMIAHYALTWWKTIPEDDIQRLKWCGLFLGEIPLPAISCCACVFQADERRRPSLNRWQALHCSMAMVWWMSPRDNKFNCAT